MHDPERPPKVVVLRLVVVFCAAINMMARKLTPNRYGVNWLYRPAATHRKKMRLYPLRSAAALWATTFMEVRAIGTINMPAAIAFTLKRPDIL